MSFYTYNQNNSGGHFIEPAGHVIIEANNENEANDIAERYGVYFDGCHSGIDCPCCGDRWYSPFHESEIPEIFGHKPEDYDAYSGIARDGIPNYMIVYKDGRVVTSQS